MIKFTQLLTPENIRQGAVISSKKRIFETIGQIIAPNFCSTDEDEDSESCCIDCLFSREKLGNSGLGNGVAMPKARLPIGEQAVAVFLQLENPIDYEAADHRDVDLVFALLIPSEICAQYATALPELAERLLDKSLCKQLRAAQSADEIWQIFELADKAYEEEQQTQEQANTAQQE